MSKFKNIAITTEICSVLSRRIEQPANRITTTTWFVARGRYIKEDATKGNYFIDCGERHIEIDIHELNRLEYQGKIEKLDWIK